MLLLRPHQWVKNTFVAAPLFFTPSAASLASVQRAILGVLAFCLVASAVYIINDYWDRASDRLHPEKRHRPLAAQTVTVPVAADLMLALLAGGFALAAALSPTFVAFVTIYFGLNLAYSLGLKDISIVDVLVIALGFVIRLEAGARPRRGQPERLDRDLFRAARAFLAVANRRDDVVRASGRIDSKNGGPYAGRESFRGRDRSAPVAGCTATLIGPCRRRPCTPGRRGAGGEPPARLCRAP